LGERRDGESLDNVREKAETERNVRYAIAIALVAAAVVAAVVLSSLHLGPHGQYVNMGGLTGAHAGDVTWRDERAGWQIPVAIVIGVLGIGGAVVAAHGKRSRVEIAPS